MDNYDIRVSNDFMEKELNQQYETLTIFRDIAKSVFSLSSIIFTIFGISQVFSNEINADFLYLYIFLIVLEIIAYAVMIVTSISVIFPSKIHGPIIPNWENLKHAFLGKDERYIEKKKLVQYLAAIDNNISIINRKHTRLCISLISFAVLTINALVIVLLFAVLL